MKKVIKETIEWHSIKDKPKKKCLHNKEIEGVWEDEEILYICKECGEITASEENTK